jgi:hypothetical protein
VRQVFRDSLGVTETPISSDAASRSDIHLTVVNVASGPDHYLRRKSRAKQQSVVCVGNKKTFHPILDIGPHILKFDMRCTSVQQHVQPEYAAEHWH